MKKIQYNGSSKILNGIVTKVNLIIDKLVVDVKVNGTSVVVVNEEGEREADIDLSLADQNVKQSPTTDNKDYRVLLSKSDNDTEETDIARKNTDFKYNPSTGNLQATKLNGNTIPTDTDTLALNKDIPTQASDIGAIPATEKGANSGVATLDSSGKVPTTQLPSYVDDVVEGYYYNDNFYEDSAHTELITPETSKIYVDLSTDTCYRWGGSAYVEISGGAVQSDWNQNDSSQLDYIKNKPTIPTIPTVNTGSVFGSLSFDGTDKIVKLTADLLAAGQDANNLKSSAVYYITSANEPLNMPTAFNNGFMIVLRYSSNVIKQIVFRQGTINSNDHQTYFRTYTESGWSKWHQFNTGEFIGGVENSDVASRAYAVNELMNRNGGVFRVTQAIASGGAITNNTNVVVTTISDELVRIISSIPTALSQLSDDSTHRLVTDTEKTTWNDKRAVNLELMTEDLNDVKTVGFYVGKSSNTCTNKPSGVNQFGLYVVKLGTSNQYYKQILIQPLTVANGGSKTYSRALYQTTWTDWVEEKYTDTTYTASGLVSIDANNNITTTAEKNPKVATGSVFGSLSFDGTNKIVKLSADSQGSGLDLNDFKTAGEYYFDNSHTPTNIPNSNNNGVLIVIETDSIIKQIWMRHGTKDSNDYNTYVRTYYSSSNNWSIWHPLVTGEMISNVEATSTSSRAYSVGDYLVYIAYFYRVTQAIAIGDTIVTSGSSANVTRVYVGDEIESVRNSIPTAITSAINDLDVSSTSIGAGETLATIKEDNGKIAVTKQSISIKNNQIENYCMVGADSSISSGVTWHKVASTTLTIANDDAIIMFAVQDAYIPDTAGTSDSNGGILYCRVRQGSPVGTHNYGKLKFVANSGLDVNNFRLYYTITSGTSITYEIWTSMNRQYAFRKFVVLSQSNRYQAATEKWTLYNSTSPTSAPTESATCVKVDCTPFNYVTWDEENVYGAKNLIPFPYMNGQAQRYYTNNNITVYTDDDGVLTITGSNPSSSFGFGISGKTYKNIIYLDPTKAYVMSGMSGGSSSTVRFLLDLWTENQNPETDTRTTRLYQADGETIIPSGYKYLQITLYFYTSAASLFPLTVNPMLRLFTAKDSTFVPYAKTNKQLTDEKVAWNDYSEYGVKNLIPYPWVHADGRSTRGILFGVEDEGYISLNGTANASNQPFFSLTSGAAENVALGKCIKVRSGKKYTLSIDRTDDRIWAIAYIRDLTGTAVSPASIAVFEDGTVRKIDSNVSNYISLSYNSIIHSSVTFEISTVGEYYLQIDLRVAANSGTYSSATAKGKVLFRDANITDDTWTKYAASNLELTKRKADYSQIATYESTNNASKAYSVGDYMIWKGVLQVVRADIASGGAITSGTNVEATDLGSEVKKSKIWGNENIATIPNSSSSSKVYVTTSAYATEIYVQRMNIRSTSLGINETGYCSVTIPILPSMTNNYFVFMFRGDVDNKLYDGRLNFKKDSNGVYGYVSKVYQDGVLKSANDLEADIVVFEKS